MYVDSILGKVFPNETGAARLQQVGLFTLILVLEARGEAATAKRLSEITGQSLSAVHLQSQKLLDVQVVRKRKVPKPRGGYVLHFFVRQNAKTRQLLKAIDKAAAKKR